MAAIKKDDLVGLAEKPLHALQVFMGLCIGNFYSKKLNPSKYD